MSYRIFMFCLLVCDYFIEKWILNGRNEEKRFPRQ